MEINSTTDPQNELLTEVDVNNKIIGAIPRGLAHQSPDKIYRTIYIVIKNNEGKLLLQRRSSSKDLYPNCWDLSVGGHVIYGQNYEETAIKELKEEMGLTATKADLRFIGEVLVKLPSSNEFFHVYEYSLKDTDQIIFSAEEVSEILWMSLKEIKNSLSNQKIPWYPRPMQVIKALY